MSRKASLNRFAKTFEGRLSTTRKESQHTNRRRRVHGRSSSESRADLLSEVARSEEVGIDQLPSRQEMTDLNRWR
jgi:hypothetical protein